MENAVREGCQHGFDKENTVNSGKFKAYQYVLNTMNKMDGEENEKE